MERFNYQDSLPASAASMSTRGGGAIPIFKTHLSREGVLGGGGVLGKEGVSRTPLGRGGDRTPPTSFFLLFPYAFSTCNVLPKVYG